MDQGLVVLAALCLDMGEQQQRANFIKARTDGLRAGEQIPRTGAGQLQIAPVVPKQSFSNCESDVLVRAPARMIFPPATDRKSRGKRLCQRDCRG